MSFFKVKSKQQLKTEELQRVKKQQQQDAEDKKRKTAARKQKLRDDKFEPTPWVWNDTAALYVQSSVQILYLLKACC